MSDRYISRIVSAVRVSSRYQNHRLRHLLLVGGLAAGVAACGGKSDGVTAAAPTTSSIAVTVGSPVRMGQTAQASGTATLSNSQTQAITSGWRSDTPTVATVSDAGLVSAVANGLATIYVVSGGRQGQQTVRVVPDYHGSWTGVLRVTTCSQTGAWASVNFCGSFGVGSTDGFSVSLGQTGEQLTARLSYGPSIIFPTIAAPIGADGASSFTATYVDLSDGSTIEASAQMRSLRVGELTGTINEVWRYPGVSGEGRLAQDVVGTTRTSTTPATVELAGGSEKVRALSRLGMKMH